MINHKFHSNPYVVMMRSKVSKDSSRGFQASSEISFLISTRKALPTSDQTIDVTFEPKFFAKTKPPPKSHACLPECFGIGLEQQT